MPYLNKDYSFKKNLIWLIYFKVYVVVQTREFL